MINIATPLSTLCLDDVSLRAIEEVTDCWEVRGNRPKNPLLKPITLYHSDLQIIHPWGEPSYDLVRRIYNAFPNISTMSFHCASLYDDPVLTMRKFYPGGKRYSFDEMICCAKNNMCCIKEIVGSSIDILIENNNYYNTGAYEIVTDPNFISTLLDETGAKFLYDVAHAHISAINRNESFQEYSAQLPLDKTMQLHLSLWNSVGEEAQDAHKLPDSALFDYVATFIKEYDAVRFCTIEYYEKEKCLISSIRKLREVIHGAL